MRVLVAGVLAAVCSVALAKRGPAEDVPPILHNGVIYSVDPDPEKMGIVEAHAATGKKLWAKRVYRIFVNPIVEADTQWVFFRSMTLEGESLVLSNERDEWFVLDLRTRHVRRVERRQAGAEAGNGREAVGNR